MGIASSKLNEEEQLKLIKMAKFRKSDVQKLYNKFNRLDQNENGLLERSELIAVKDISENPLVKRVIKALDLKGNNRINFQELLVGFGKILSNFNVPALIYIYINKEKKSLRVSDPCFLYEMNK